MDDPVPRAGMVSIGVDTRGLEGESEGEEGRREESEESLDGGTVEESQ